MLPRPASAALRAWSRARLRPRSAAVCLVGLAALLSVCLGRVFVSGGGSPAGGRVRRLRAPRVPRQQARQDVAEPRKVPESPSLGVVWNHNAGKWWAGVRDPETGREISLGLYEASRDALKARDMATLLLEGEEVDLNMPRELYTEKLLAEAQKKLNDKFAKRPSSRYYGVYQTLPDPDKWHAEHEFNPQKFHIAEGIFYVGAYESEVEAALAVDIERRTHIKRFSRALVLPRLNFPTDGDWFDEATLEDELIHEKKYPTSSRFIGVRYFQPTEQFQAKLGRKNLGLFDTELEAAKAFDKASLAVGGRTNFKPAAGGPPGAGEAAVAGDADGAAAEDPQSAP